ncbi:MAG: hypothetical protein LBC59_02315 [Chitinispirillales bacterium]|nr:hypothetical protein [Chitinispirillales bacterium]
MRTLKILLLAVSVIHAASIDYRVSFDGVLDNREYGVEPLNDETFFFARGAAEVGIAVDGENRIWGGFMPTVWFGAPDTAHIPTNTLMYFQHESDRTRFRFGAFPRSGALESLPVWFFGDESAYRRPYVHGAAVDVGDFRGLTADAWVDWTGLRDVDVNEAFLFGYGLSYVHGAFFVRHDFMMYHFALPLNPAPGEAVKDNGGASAEIGAAWGKIAKYIDTLSASAGMVASLDRDRSDMVWHTPVGGFIGGFAGYGMAALRCFYYAGQAQRMAWGESFYRYSGLESFGRGDVILRFFNKNRDASDKNLSAELTASFYLIDGKIGSSQHFVLHADYGTYPK